MKRHVVGMITELPPGDRKIVPVGGTDGIGVFNVKGRFYALKNLSVRTKAVPFAKDGCGPM